MKTVLPPVDPRVTQYGIDVAKLKMRAANLAGMTSVLVRDLFPEAPRPIYPGADLGVIRKHTQESLKKLDLSRIKPGDSVNILGSHHGFTLFGGSPYAELIRTVRDFVVEKTGVRDIRLKVGVGLRFRESEEYIKKYELDNYFAGKAEGIAPVDRPITLDTEIGPLYGIAKAFDADWIIHTHNSDLREVHFHRVVDKTFKPFAMSYSRIETRSTYHHNLGPRGANLVSRAVFNSPQVQDKFVASVILKTSPVGIVGIDADNDMYAQNDRLTIETLTYYGKIIRLLNKIDRCIAIIDCPAPIPYTFAAGIIFANFMSAGVDPFDLSIPQTPYSLYSEMSYGCNGKPLIPDIQPLNPAVRAVINNYSFKGYPSAFFAAQTPTIVVGNEMAQLFEQCEQNQEYMEHAVQAGSLTNAVKFAQRLAGTDQMIIFDGVVGGLNVSESMKELLVRQAPAVKQEVEEVLLPKWLNQRGITYDCQVSTDRR